MTLLTAAGYLTSDLFIPSAGVANKVYSQANSGVGGLACHSIVGEEKDFEDGIPNRFLSLDKDADGDYTSYAAASCMFILRKRRPHVQMYPITASTWTSGSRGANTTTWAMEAEGGGYGNYSEPLTEHQIKGFLAIAAAWQEKFGKALVIGKTVRAHWMLARDFGSDATACESGRYAEAWRRLAEEGIDNVDAEARAAIEKQNQEIKKLVEYDANFNGVMVRRMQIQALANGTNEKDFAKMEKAWEVLNKAGLFS